MAIPKIRRLEAENGRLSSTHGVRLRSYSYVVLMPTADGGVSSRELESDHELTAGELISLDRRRWLVHEVRPPFSPGHRPTVVVKPPRYPARVG